MKPSSRLRNFRPWHCDHKNLRAWSFTLVLVGSAWGLRSVAQESTRILPQGRHAVRSVFVQSPSITQSFDSSFKSQNVFSPLELRLNAEDLGRMNPSLGQLVQALNSLEPGLGSQLVEYRYRAKGEIQSQRQVFAFERGLTSRLSAGISVARVRQVTQVTIQGNQTQQTAAATQSVEGTVLASKVAAFEKQIPSADQVLDAALESRGYILPRETISEGWSDLDLGVKYLIQDSGRLSSALVGAVRVPTATHQADPANPLDRSSGDRQWDFSLQGVQSFKPVSRLNLSWSTKLTWQLQDSEQRYLAARNDPLPPKVNDPESAFAVTRDLGDLIETEVSASSSFVNSLLNPYAAYQYAYKGADSYSAAVDRDVDRLSQKTQTQSHRFEVGLTVSTVSRAIEGNVKLPVELKVAWNQNLGGQNIPRAHYGRIDLVLFF